MVKTLISIKSDEDFKKKLVLLVILPLFAGTFGTAFGIVIGRFMWYLLTGDIR